MDDTPDNPEVDDLPLTGLSKIILPVPKVNRACVACAWSAKEGADRVCRFNPPQSTFLALPSMQPGPGGRPQQGFAIQPFCGFPIMRDDQWCGKFEKRGAG